MALTPGPMAISNSGANLLLFGRYSQWVCAESPSHDPSAARRPDLAIGSTTVAMPVLCVRNMRLGDPRRLTHLQAAMINGPFFQPTDQIDLVLQADEWKQWEAKPSRGAPAHWDLDHVFGDHAETHLWAAVKLDSATRSAAPYISIGILEHEDRGEPYTSLAQHAATPNPEVT